MLMPLIASSFGVVGRRARAWGPLLAAFTSLTATVAASASGCGMDSTTRSYCDASGCFECDGYGCTSVSPAKPGCTATSGGAGCSSECSSTTPCGPGETCNAGRCTATTANTPANQCSTRGECPRGACQDGTCEACGGTLGPCSCHAASDCESGQTCAGGACTAQRNACAFANDCADGKACADGQCLARCVTECADGGRCDKGVCRPPVATICTRDAQCPADAPLCAAGTCAPACTTSNDCSAGRFCDQGACVPDTRPQTNCTEDAECGATPGTPKKCIRGFCKYTCSAHDGDAYCRTIDSRIGTCAKDLVCRTASEANASCIEAASCSPGQSCIDNACR